MGGGFYLKEVGNLLFKANKFVTVSSAVDGGLIYSQDIDTIIEF